MNNRQWKKNKEKPSIITRLVTPEELYDTHRLLPQGPPELHPKTSGRQSKTVPKRQIIPKTKTGPSQEGKALPKPDTDVSKNKDIKAGTADNSKEAIQPGEAGRSGDGSGQGKGMTSTKPWTGTKTPSVRERLFDREVIGAVVKKGEEKQNDNITFDTNEMKYSLYMGKLKGRVEGIWKYPVAAIERRLYGDVRINFTIKKDGTLNNIELARTSGHRSLDEAAIQALKDAQPFWPLPEDWGKDSITIKGHFIYSIYGPYLR